uniref:Uncharacterized protein n=1 Tax=Glossina austeni TaxID=7395 RepID=A0A1A9UF03_GLOAU
MSTKASSQPGRRTPLSLSGTVAKTPSNSKTANSNNAGSNGHPANANAKADDKNQQKSEQLVSNNKMDVKDQTTQPHANKRMDKSQNGVGGVNSKMSGNTNVRERHQHQQQQQTQQQMQQQQNGNDNKLNENSNVKDKREKAEKVERKEKSEKDDKQNKAKDKNEKKLKDDKATEEAKAELEVVPPKHENKGAEKKKEPVVQEKSVPNDNATEQKTLDKKEEKMEFEESMKSSTPSTPKSKEDHKVASPTTKTVKAAASTKVGVEKASQKLGTVNSMEKPTTIVLVVDDEEEPYSSADAPEMEPLVMDVSPKKLQSEHLKATSLSPSATSTPGKALSSKRNRATVISEAQLSTQYSSLPERPRPFSQISGRRSIRPITDYTASKFQGNLHYRESYRRIDSELDTTSSSLNVTVGSEPANNSSFFFFGRGRKRERTPPPTKLQSTDGLSEIEVSPPKKARMDFLSVVYSPITMLRNRFSRASLQSSTPVNLHQKFNTEIEVQNDEIEVQNVSGEITTQEDLPMPISSKKNDITEIQGNNDDVTLGLEIEPENSTSDTEREDVNKEMYRNTQKTCCLDTEGSDIQFKETPLPSGDGITVSKNKRCAIM